MGDPIGTSGKLGQVACCYCGRWFNPELVKLHERLCKLLHREEGMR
jgi:hypothetical protein